MRRVDIFSGDGTRDRGGMHSDDLRDVIHGQGLQKAGAIFQKGTLAIDDLTRDCEDRFLPLINGSNDHAPVTNLIP